MAPPTLTLVLPVLDGARYLERSLEDAATWLRGHAPSELIVVDDGSSDETAQILADFERRWDDPGVRVWSLRNPVNRGKGYSVRRGLLAGSAPIRVFNDADMTYPTHNLDGLVEALRTGADVAVGCRVHPGSRYVVAPDFFRYIYTRHNAGRIFNWLVRGLVVNGLRDTQAGIKGFRAAVVEDLFPRLTRDRFAFDVELLFLAQRRGYRIAEVPVTYVYCKEPSTLSFAEDTMAMCADLVRIRVRERRGAYDEAPAAREPAAAPRKTEAPREEPEPR